MKDNKVKVNGKEFSVQATLGEGAFAFVYKCKAPDGSLVAIKSLQLQDSAAQEEALAEAALFKQIPFHPYLVKFIDSESHRGQLFIVQELLGESLFSMMQKKSERPNDFFDDLFVLTVVSQISSALAHLHSMDIFHRDVKPENILLAAKSPRNLWKLCDFGSARRGIAAPTNEEQRASLEREIEAKTSLSYRAPEMLDLFRAQPIGGPADVWALGVTTYYTAFLVQPFPDGHLAILNGRISFPASSSSSACARLATLMLIQLPSARPTAAAVHSTCERVLLGDASAGAIAVPASPRTIPAGGSPRVSTPVSVKKVGPLDAELATLVKAAQQQQHQSLPQQQPEEAFKQPAPPAPAAVPAVPAVPANNEALVAEAKRCLADIKVLKDPDAWRLEISAELVAPTCRDVIVKAYKTASRPFVASKSRVTDLFAQFRDFVIRGNPAEVFQMLSIFHVALQSGSFLACAAAWHRKSFLDDVAAHDSDVMRLYSLFLSEKVTFHNNFRFVEGNMSIGTYNMILQLNQFKTSLVYMEDGLFSPELLQALMSLLEKVIALQARLLQLRENATIALFLIPVVKESFSLSVLLGHLGRSYPRAVSSAVAQGFAAAMQTLRGHYDIVNSIAAIGGAPDLNVALSGTVPSHSPFVNAFLEKQRFQLASTAAAPQFEANFAANFPMQENPRAAVNVKPVSQPVSQPVQAVQPVSQAVQSVSQSAQPVSQPVQPVSQSAQPSSQPNIAQQHQAVSALDVLSKPSFSPAVASASSPTSSLPSKVKEERLRRVGSRRGSVRDISEMRETSSRDLSDLALSRDLDNKTREELIAIVLDLRRKVASLEQNQ